MQGGRKSVFCATGKSFSFFFLFIFLSSGKLTKRKITRKEKEKGHPGKN